MTSDLRASLRALARSPGFVAAGVLTLALASGIMTAVSAVVSAVLLAPLPVRDEGSILVVWKEDVAAGFAHWPFSYPAVRALQGQLTTVTDMATVDYNGAYTLSTIEGDHGITLMTGIISGNLMPLLGVAPIVGRTILASDDVVGAPRVAVISEGLWQSHYGRARDVVGRLIPLYGNSYEIVGVVRAGFGLPAATVMWIAQKPFQPMVLARDDYALADLVVRLKPGVSREAFRAELEAVRARTPLEATVPYKTHRVIAQPLREVIVGESRPTLLLLGAGALLVLLVAAVNLGGLFLVRAGGRMHEIAVRSAIGGDGFRSVRALGIEFAVVVVTGVTLGIPVALLVLTMLGPLLPADLPTQVAIGLRPGPVLLVALGSLLAATLGAAAPVTAIARADLVATLKAGGRAAAGWGVHPIRRVMVSAQVAFAATIVVGAGLMLRTLERLHRIEPGFRPTGALFVDVTDSRDFDTTVVKQRNQVDRVLGKLRSVPGVLSASALFSPPFVGNGGFYAKLAPQGMPEADAARMPFANVEVVAPDADRALGLTVTRGRFIDAGDREDLPRSIVLNETAVRLLWPAQDPLGRRVYAPVAPPANWAVVVGVVADTRYNELRRPAPMMYFSYRQMVEIPPHFILRAASDRAALALVPALRRAVVEADPALALRSADPLNELLAAPLARPRLAAVLISCFAGVVLVLAAIGIYGIMASFVVQRTRELGVRMALGATSRRVRQLVLRQGLLLAAGGLAVGLALAAGASRLLGSLLYEVRPADPPTYGVVAAVLLLVAALAVMAPARRASRLDPAIALRSE